LFRSTTSLHIVSSSSLTFSIAAITLADIRPLNDAVERLRCVLLAWATFLCLVRPVLPALRSAGSVISPHPIKLPPTAD
jgi:hypothetical protein